MKKYLINFLKGFIIGGSMTVPGVSGGAMAIILDLYDKLVDAMSNMFKNFKENFLFVFSTALGGLFGLFSFAHLVSYLLEVFHLPIIYLFMGCILGSLPIVVHKAKEKHFNWKSIIFPIIGCAIVIGFTFIPMNDGFEFKQTFGSYAYIFITGITVSISLVLPGLSTSLMLKILGMHEYFLHAITDFNILFLAVLGIATIIGFLVTVKVVDYLIKHFPNYVFLTILGFIIGSIYTIFPKELPQGLNILYCILMFIVGFVPLMFITMRTGDKE